MPRIDTPYSSRTHRHDAGEPSGMPLWPWIAIAALAGATLFTEVLAHDSPAMHVSLPGLPCTGHAQPHVA